MDGLIVLVQANIEMLTIKRTFVDNGGKMKGELESGKTFEMTPDWLKSWEQENGSTYYSCGCGWKGTRPLKSDRLYIEMSGGIDTKLELRCPECGEIVEIK